MQLSVQHSDPASSDKIAGHPSFEDKKAAARLIKERGLPLGLNVVLHHENLDAIDAIMQLAVDWQADRIELANAQFYGWGLLNRATLMPTRDQLTHANTVIDSWRKSLDGAIDITWVEPDYFSGKPKPCMGGWGAVSLTIAPDGTALPCPAAASLPDLDAPNAFDQPLSWLWKHSPAFNRFRGTQWMPSPCQTCDLRSKDFGGCRCQAYALTGDAARTDPACSLSPDHGIIVDATLETGTRTAVPVPRRPIRGPWPANHR
ncbi:SPASM domain-containing protein [Streptomyces sp. NBC_01378]|uniref:SPASM domain-containing protein n=1 Tax=Streptomyces sp. NBC_01378 TaxID=2903844 RepID=UPI00386E67D2